MRDRETQTRGAQNTRVLVALTLAGLLVRIVLLVLVGDSELKSDEARYAYAGISWLYLGVYDDSQRFLWPPGYAFVFVTALRAFGDDALLAIKLFQILSSAAIGLSTMLFARRLFGARAAVIAGAIWCLHLPLASFTHLLWPETLFLALLMPALLLLLGVLQDDPAGTRSDGRILAAALLLVAALHLKQVALYLIVALALLLALRRALRPASLLVLASIAGVLPWTIRNYEVYERFVLVGVTLGENAFHGLNERYTNFDVVAFDRLEEEPGRLQAVRRSWFVDAEPGSGWKRAEEIRNTPDRIQENWRRGVRYALDHPGWLLRSRIKKLADFVTPLSFGIRHQALDRYEGPLGERGLQRAGVVWALASSTVVMLLAVVGYFWSLPPGAGRQLVTILVGYFVATSLVVSMSRFRLPLVPILIVLAAGLVSGGPSAWANSLSARLGSVVAVGALAFLWWVNLPEVAAVVELAWR